MFIFVDTTYEYRACITRFECAEIERVLLDGGDGHLEWRYTRVWSTNCKHLHELDHQTHVWECRRCLDLSADDIYPRIPARSITTQTFAQHPPYPPRFYTQA